MVCCYSTGWRCLLLESLIVPLLCVLNVVYLITSVHFVLLFYASEVRQEQGLCFHKPAGQDGSARSQLLFIRLV